MSEALNHRRLNPSRFALPALVLALGALLAACPGQDPHDDDGGTPEPQCEARDQCEGGQVCTSEKYCADCESSGQCRLKEECRAEPDAGIQRCALRAGWGEQCERNGDCGAGQWCVQGLCKDSSLVRLCPNGTSDECLSHERCNTLNLVCEEDLGCAENGDCSSVEVCNTGSHQCVPKCTPENEADLCEGGERCVNEHCVQCETDADCEVGLVCDAAGRCATQQRCYADRDCKVPLVCYEQTGTCVSKPPPCISDENCAPDQRCNVGTGKCVPRDCQPDLYEPDDDLAHARALTPGSYTQLTLCENDVDVYAFSLSRTDQLGVNVEADPFSENTFTTEVRDGNGRTLSSGKLLTSYTAGSPGTYYVFISTSDRYQPYDVRFLLSRGTPCDDDGWEPNDTTGTATPLNSSGLVDGAICPQDQDHFSLAIPAGQGVSVSFEGYDSSQGLLRLCLLEGATELSCSEDPAVPLVSATAAQAGGKTVEVRVDAVNPGSQNVYTLKVVVQ